MIALFLALSLAHAHAHAPPPATKPGKPAALAGLRAYFGVQACQGLKQVCSKAGYKKRAHNSTGKGLFKDCLGKLVQRQKVAGVSLDPKDPMIDKCLAAAEAAKASGAQGGKGRKSAKTAR